MEKTNTQNLSGWKRFKYKMKFVKFRDVLAIFQMILVLPIALICKIFIRNFWLVCEDKNEARDNGYWFFKYVVSNHKKQKIAYAINKKSVDYEKVKKLGKVVNYGGFSHWFWYIVADKNISSQKGGKPNAAVCYLFEVVFKMRKNNRIFLQHGIIINDVKFLYYKETYMKMFITSTKAEYDFLENNFGYPKGSIVLTGLPRFDNLDRNSINKDLILLMPTWRQWVAKGVEMQGIEGSNVFTETEYFKKWNEFLSSERLNSILEKYNKKLLFYPHRNMQPFLKYFNTTSKYIELCDWENNDIQEVLKKTSLMITDYSSVFFDFVYMQKPVIFYQFDYDEFRKNQYGEGYFNYKNNKISQYADSLEKTLDLLEENIKNDFEMKNKNCYLQYFKYIDKNNCQRVYESIKNINKGKCK